MSVVDGDQLIWDQLLARGWITDMTMIACLARFNRITGRDPDELQRVPIGYARQSPVRAIFAQQWPKLSGWLWKRPLKSMQTDEFEARLVRLVSEREFTRPTGSILSLSDKRAVRREARRARATQMLAEQTKEKMNANHDWKLTKPVRS